MMADDGVAERPFQPTPEIQAWLNELNRIGNDLDTMTRETVAAVRLVRQQRAQSFLWQIPLETVRDFLLPGAEHPVGVRLYAPQDQHLARDGKLPVVVSIMAGDGLWAIRAPMTR